MKFPTTLYVQFDSIQQAYFAYPRMDDLVVALPVAQYSLGREGLSVHVSRELIEAPAKKKARAVK